MGVTLGLVIHKESQQLAENLNVVVKHHKLAILDVVSDKTLLKKILFYVLNSCWDYC